MHKDFQSTSAGNDATVVLSGYKHYRYISCFIIALLALSLAGYPLVAALTSLLDVENRSAALVFRLALFFFSAAVIFAGLARRVHFFRSPAWTLLAVFWIVYITRLWLDTLINLVPLSRDPIEYWIWAIGGCLIPMVALMARPDATTSRNALVATYLIAASAATLVLVAIWVDIGTGISRIVESGRLELSALNPISVGHLGGSLALITTYRILRVENQRISVLTRATYALFAVVGILLLIASGSRGALAGTIVAILAFAAARIRSRVNLLAVVFIISLVAFGFLAATYAEDKFGLVTVSRLVGGINPESDVATSGRLQLIGAAWSQFLDSPILGSGVEVSGELDYPHNVVIESFMATGVLGGTAFTLLVLYAVRTSWRQLRSVSQQGWIAILCIQYIVGAQFSGSLW